jgi:hypothetical protein
MKQRRTKLWNGTNEESKQSLKITAGLSSEIENLKGREKESDILHNRLEI